jgi:hypothetical protein
MAKPSVWLVGVPEKYLPYDIYLYYSFRLTKILNFWKIKANFIVQFDIVNKGSYAVESIPWRRWRWFVFFQTNYLLCLLGQIFTVSAWKIDFSVLNILTHRAANPIVCIFPITIRFFIGQ